MLVLPVVLLVTLALAVAAALLHARRRRRATDLLEQILDLADGLEGDLRECRRQLADVSALAAITTRSAVSARPLARRDVVDAALRDLLAHRLWLQRHANRASLREFVAARDALRGTRQVISTRLDELRRARLDLERCGADAGFAQLAWSSEVLPGAPP